MAATRLGCTVRNLRLKHNMIDGYGPWVLRQYGAASGACGSFLRNYLIQISNECCIIKFTIFSVVSLCTREYQLCLA